jgi:hypothetical protein
MLTDCITVNVREAETLLMDSKGYSCADSIWIQSAEWKV